MSVRRHGVSSRSIGLTLALGLAVAIAPACDAPDFVAVDGAVPTTSGDAAADAIHRAMDGGHSMDAARGDSAPANDASDDVRVPKDAGTGHDAIVLEDTGTHHDAKQAHDTGVDAEKTCPAGVAACSTATSCGPAPVCKIAICESECCGTMSSPARTVCGTAPKMLCDGSGNCVQCTESSDCTILGIAGLTTCNASGKCV